MKKKETILVISKEEFKAEIKEVINSGNNLFRDKVTNAETFNLFIDQYTLWTDFNSTFLMRAFNNLHNEYYKDYSSITNSPLDYSRYERPDELGLQKGLLKKKLACLNRILAQAHLLKTSSKNEMENNKNQVFIVHGHDNETKVETARFVENLGFEAIILHEQASSSKTIIEKIEEYSDVGFGIVLYTPCDIGGKKIESPNLQSRARQNVVFEHGFLIGKIGRNNVCALVKGDVELPNDISGVVYEKIDNGNGWKYKVAKEMKASGYNVDMNKI